MTFDLESDNMQASPSRILSFMDSSTDHIGPDILDAEEWINMPMGVLFGNEFDMNTAF